MLTLRQIEVFIAVMRAGSITGAARELGIAQPTVSRILGRIEDQLGVAVFDRAGGGLTPTNDAWRIAGELERAYDQLQAATVRAVGAVRRQPGVFHIAASPSVGRVLVPGVLAALAREEPGISLRFEVLSVAQMAPFLTETAGDGAVTLFPVRHRAVRAVAVGSTPLVAVVPRASSLARREWLAPADLSGQSVVVYEAWSVHGKAADAVLSEAGAPPARTHQVRFPESAVALAEAGAAIALLDSFSAGSADRDRAVVLPVKTAQRFEVWLNRPVGQLRGWLMLRFERLLTAAIGSPSSP
ncbi:MAG: LysR family transcriptional regulator [Acetobacteraceae bacterium]|nr:LysR family transcriptional regulator [Acetobacteraceae bacterium]MDW8397336.1 LysR family transcriptional regulator [Acetobacteraceae bacterium]